MGVMKFLCGGRPEKRGVTERRIQRQLWYSDKAHYRVKKGLTEIITKKNPELQLFF